MNVPSPRQLKLERFERPDFRATTPRGKHAQGWTWTRAMHRLRSWMARSTRNLANDTLRAVAPLSRAYRALKSMRPQRMPRLNTRVTADHLGGYRVVATYTVTAPRQPGPLRRAVKQVGRRSAPARLSARRVGAHRLDQIAILSSKAYMGALDARQRYVIAPLLDLNMLTNKRANGETSWMEARRADRYAAA
jgi:hypothetical protein